MTGIIGIPPFLTKKLLDTTGYHDSMKTLFSTIKTIHQELEPHDQANLITSYVTLLFKTLNYKLAYESGDEGLLKAGELRTLCRNIYDKNNGKCKDPFYPTAKEYFSKEKQGNTNNRSLILNKGYLLLADQYFELAATEYYNQIQLSLEPEIEKLNILYSKIADLIGEEIIYNLYSQFITRFRMVSTFCIFQQGMNNDLLYTFMELDFSNDWQQILNIF